MSRETEFTRLLGDKPRAQYLEMLANALKIMGTGTGAELAAKIGEPDPELVHYGLLVLAAQKKVVQLGWVRFAHLSWSPEPDSLADRAVSKAMYGHVK